MAEAVKRGVDSVEGCEGVLLRAAETLPDEVLEKMHAPAKDSKIPVVDVADLPSYDGFLFGLPTRFGLMSGQMKAFFDATGGHWQVCDTH
jgi:NAD(P)H dehydrogenase (quinone)